MNKPKNRYVYKRYTYIVEIIYLCSSFASEMVVCQIFSIITQPALFDEEDYAMLFKAPEKGY